MFRNHSETINLSESSSNGYPVNISGEIKVSDTDIASDADDANEQVHAVASDLNDAIEGVLAEYREDDR